jgi:hypothetical protein
VGDVAVVPGADNVLGVIFSVAELSLFVEIRWMPHRERLSRRGFHSFCIRGAEEFGPFAHDCIANSVVELQVPDSYREPSIPAWRKPLRTVNDDREQDMDNSSWTVGKITITKHVEMLYWAPITPAVAQAMIGASFEDILAMDWLDPTWVNEAGRSPAASIPF